MSQYYLFALAIYFILVCSLFSPTKAAAAELDSIYISVRISPEQYQKWLESPMKHMHDYNDWEQMTDEWDEYWEKDYYEWDFGTMGEMVEGFKGEEEAIDWSYGSPPYVNYDPREGVFTFAQLLFGDNYIDFMLYLSAFRALADFKDTEEPDFLAIYPRLWDPGYAVIMEIGKGYTKFYSENDASPEFQEFIKKANAHFDKEIASLEG